MERLTEINERGEGIDCYPKSRWPLGFVIGQEHPLYDIARKLAEYEDLEEQGKLLKLPCEVGDTVYVTDRFCGGHALDCPCRPCESCGDYQLEIYEEEFKLNNLNDFGKTVFLTIEEAEAALKELERGKGK